MGSYTFRWTAPAEEVYVTGTFDNWSKSVQLTKDSGVFSKKVDLPSADEDIFYKFVVDDKWTTESNQPTAKDHEGNENNILRKEEIQKHSAGEDSYNTASAFRSGVGPGATTASLAGAVPLEKNKMEHEDMPGTFPSETPISNAPGGSSGPSVMDFFSPGDIVPDFSQYTSATWQSDKSTPQKKDDSSNAGERAADNDAGIVGAAAATGAAAVEGAKNASASAKQATTGTKENEQRFGVNPLPATSGIGNPINTTPGEKLPPSGDYTAETTTSNVKLDKEAYEKSDAYPTSSGKRDNAAGEAGVTMIPESGGMPMATGGTSSGPADIAAIRSAMSSGPADIAAIRSAAGGETTTAELAGQQPIQPRGVPEVVRDSQQEAHASPEASTNPTATAEKSAMEQELKKTVPEEQPASESHKGMVAGVAGGAAAAATGAASYAAGVPAAISNAISHYRHGNHGDPNEKPVDAVPDVVKESEKEANAAPEAAANPEAVQEKSEMERELQSKIAPSNETGASDESGEFADAVPEVVKQSDREAHASPEAAANPEAVQEKSDMERELQSRIAPSSATGNETGEPADAVPEMVKESEKEANFPPEATANPEAVQEKSEMERELQSKISPSNETGEPAPATSAATMAEAPHPQTGSEGGQGKDASKDLDDTSNDDTSKAKEGGIIAGVTGAAAAAGGAAYAATEKAKDKAEQATGTSKDIPSTHTTSSTSAFAKDPVSANDATTTGGSMFGGDPTIADEGTAGALAAATGLGNVGEESAETPTAKDEPVAPVADSGASAIKPTDDEKEGGLNASKETPAQSVATEAKQIASEPESSASVAATKSPASDEKAKGPLPGTTMLPSSSKSKPRQDSRDVSPMTRPEVTTGTESASSPAKQTSGASSAPSAAKKGHSRNESSMTTGSASGSPGEEKKNKRRSFFGKLKDKLKN